MKLTIANLSKIAFSLFVLAVMPSLFGCNKSNSQSASAVTDKGPVIEFRRTPCFGTCPIYRASITQSGKVTFTGERFIDKIGTFEGTISEAEVTNFLNEADKAQFFERDSLYVTGATDFPSQILRIKNHGKSHTIRTEGEGPQEIEALMQRIDRAILRAVGAAKAPAEGN